MAKPELKIKPLNLALIGGETLLGRELQDVLQKSAEKTVITGYASTGEGNFAEQEGEAIYLAPLEAKAAVGYDAILLAGLTHEGALKSYEIAKAAKGHPLLIDCVGYLESQPEARISSPLIAESGRDAGWLRIVAHPAATAMALVLTRLANHAGLKMTIAHVFEPASERGKPAVSELHQQTTSLLAFKKIEKKIFDTQLTFNLLSQYGEDAPVKLSAVEQRIERHLATLLDKHAGIGPSHMPSVRLIQAPVFHGYSISLWLEFENMTSAAEIAGALASDRIDVRGEEHEPPEAVGAAGHSGIIAGDIRSDRNNSRAVWMWITGDNLRLTSDAAAEIVGSLRCPAK